MRKSIRDLIKNQKTEGQKLPSERTDLRTVPSTGSIAAQIRRRRLKFEPPSGSTDIIYGQELGEDYGKFGNHVIPEERNINELYNIEEQAAQNQGKGEKLLHGIGRVATKTIAELGKGIGYIGGAIPAALMSDIEVMTDNFLVEMFQNIEEDAKEALPVFIRDEVENGSLARQIWSPEFWAGEGADGIGFLLSAVISGGTAGAISKSLNIGTKVAKIADKGAKTANAIDNGIITGTQTFIESAAETKGIVDSLKQDWERYRQEDGTFLKNGQSYSANEITDMIGQAGVETMAINSLLLWGPNALQTKYLFGKGDDMKGLFKGMDVSTPEKMKEVLSKMKPWKRGISNAMVQGVKSAGAEGWQELSQFAIENYESKKGKGINNIGLFEGLLEGYIEGLSTIEGQKSIFLGAVLGLGPGAIGAYKKTKAENAQATSLTELMGTSSAEFRDGITAIYQKNENGTIKLDKRDKPLIDQEKFKELMDSNQQDLVLSKLYQEAKQDGRAEEAKHILAEMTIKSVFPYLTIENGIDIWKGHVEGMMEVIESDAVELGFNNKQEYTDFLTKIATTAKQELSKVRNYGPAFFGIETKKLIKNKTDVANVSEKLQGFIANVEYNAVRLTVLSDEIGNKLTEIGKEIKVLESIKEDVEENNDSTKGIVNAKLDRLNKIREGLREAQKNVSDKYSLLFNKVQQQKAFDNIIEETKEIQKAVEADEIKQKVDSEFSKKFYGNLIKKGYNVNPTKDNEINDFGQETVTLVGDDGKVYRIEKRPNKKTKTTDFVIRHLEDDTNSNNKTSKEVELTPENLIKLGLDKAENVLTKAEFQEWAQATRILKRNAARLIGLRNLISDHKRTQHRFEKQIRDLQEELTEYQSTLSLYEENRSMFTGEVILTEVINLEEKIAAIEAQLQDLYDQKESLGQTQLVLQQLSSEIQELVNNKSRKEFSFEVKLKELENKLLNEGFLLDMQDIDENIVIIEEFIEELEGVKAKMVDFRQDLVDAFRNMEYVESLFDLDVNSMTLSSKMKEFFPEISIAGNRMENLSKEEIKALLDNPSVRVELLAAIKAQKGEMLSQYKANEEYIDSLQREIGNLKRETNRFRQNKKLLIKYEKLGVNYKTLQYRNNLAIDLGISQDIAANLSSNQKRWFSSSPQEQLVVSRDETKEKDVKKHSPYTTISQIWKGKRDETGTYVVERDVNGNKILNDNYTQGARWDSILGDISLDDLENYHVRIVNNTQLQELGEKPPTDEENALYAVLYDLREEQPVSTEDGIAFTGIAKPETYFADDYTTVELSRLPEYKPYLGKPISAEKPLVFNNVEYTEVEELNKAIITEVANDYKVWRESLLEKVNEGQELYSRITDISKGSPRYGTKTSSPTDILNVNSLKIPNKNILSKDNGSVITVEPGFVYAKLENGQYQRLLNYKLKDRPDKDARINTIINFIALANEIKDHNFKTRFRYKNSKSRIPLITSDAKTTGILDYYINWGNFGQSKNSEFSIMLFPTNKLNPNSDIELVFTHKGRKEKMLVKDLFDDKGKVRKVGDEHIMNLVTFLENKFANVVSRELNKEMKNGFYMPTSWYKDSKTGEIIIEKKNHNSYNEYVLTKSLYTNIENYEVGTDKIPNFVNKYITFDEETVPKLPPIVKSKGEALLVAEGKDTTPAVVADGAAFLAAQGAPTDSYVDAETGPAISGANFLASQEDASHASMPIVEIASPVEKDKAKCKKGSKKNPFKNKRPKEK